MVGHLSQNEGSYFMKEQDSNMCLAEKNLKRSNHTSTITIRTENIGKEFGYKNGLVLHEL